MPFDISANMRCRSVPTQTESSDEMLLINYDLAAMYVFICHVIKMLIGSQSITPKNIYQNISVSFHYLIENEVKRFDFIHRSK